MSTATPDTTSAPDWDLIPFDVTCARCGHDLRGQSDPRCPACEFEFEWSKAVPIEALTCVHCGYSLYGLTDTRCPECGQSFTWELVLSIHRRRKYELFEYRWRESLFRSYWHTHSQVHWPRRFWNGFDIHDPPNVRALFVLALFAMLLSVVLVEVMTLRVTHSVARNMPGVGTLALWRSVALVNAALTFGVLALWSLFSLAALLLFQQSMRRFKVRTAQVIRVWAYAVPAWSPAIFLISSASTIVFGPAVSSQIPPSRVGLPPQLLVHLAFAVICLVFVVRSIRYGYGLYLRMWHSWAIAIASQCLAVLATSTTLVVIDSFV